MLELIIGILILAVFVDHLTRMGYVKSFFYVLLTEIISFILMIFIVFYAPILHALLIGIFGISFFTYYYVGVNIYKLKEKLAKKVALWMSFIILPAMLFAMDFLLNSNYLSMMGVTL